MKATQRAADAVAERDDRGARRDDRLRPRPDHRHLSRREARDPARGRAAPPSASAEVARALGDRKEVVVLGAAGAARSAIHFPEQAVPPPEPASVPPPPAEKPGDEGGTLCLPSGGDSGGRRSGPSDWSRASDRRPQHRRRRRGQLLPLRRRRSASISRRRSPRRSSPRPSPRRSSQRPSPRRSSQRPVRLLMLRQTSPRRGRRGGRQLAPQHRLSAHGHQGLRDRTDRGRGHHVGGLIAYVKPRDFRYRRAKRFLLPARERRSAGRMDELHSPGLAAQYRSLWR